MIAPDAGEAAGQVPALEELLDHLRVDLLKSSGAYRAAACFSMSSMRRAAPIAPFWSPASWR